MRSLRKHPEVGTRIETATLIGLTADEWQFSHVQWIKRLVFLPDWTGGLAYRDATVMEALLKARGPRQSPALPIASTGPGAEDNIRPILCISEQCGDESSPVFSLILCSKVLSEECRTRGVSEKKRWERMNEAEQFSVKAHQNTIYLEACICLRETIQTLFPL